MGGTCKCQVSRILDGRWIREASAGGDLNGEVVRVRKDRKGCLTWPNAFY